MLYARGNFDFPVILHFFFSLPAFFRRGGQQTPVPLLSRRGDSSPLFLEFYRTKLKGERKGERAPSSRSFHPRGEEGGIPFAPFLFSSQNETPQSERVAKWRRPSPKRRDARAKKVVNFIWETARSTFRDQLCAIRSPKRRSFLPFPFEMFDNRPRQRLDGPMRLLSHLSWWSQH